MARRVRCVVINYGRVKRQEGKGLTFLRYCKGMFYKHRCRNPDSVEERGISLLTSIGQGFRPQSLER